MTILKLQNAKDNNFLYLLGKNGDFFLISKIQVQVQVQYALFKNHYSVHNISLVTYTKYALKRAFESKIYTVSNIMVHHLEYYLSLE